MMRIHVVSGLAAAGGILMAAGAAVAASQGPGKVGQVTFETSCTPQAHEAFTHGLAMLHSFWFRPAIESFNEAARLDPACGIAHWGTALATIGNPLASPPPPKALADGAAAVARGKAAAVKTQRERDYVSAVEVFYRDHERADHRSRVLAYEKAMEGLSAKYPQDREAKVFYALALNMSVVPTDKTYANQLKAGRLLEEVFAEQPEHPGVAHYLIHSYDYPPIAKQGLTAAQRYAGIAPAVPHAQHMPSHVFTRLGHWDDSISSNRTSAEIAQKETASRHPPATASWEALHALDYMTYAYLQKGQDGEAKKVLDLVATYDSADLDHLGSAYAFAAIPARYALERQKWDEAAALALVPKGFAWAKFPQAQTVVEFARAYGAARQGKIAEAKESIEIIGRLQSTLVSMQQGYWADQADIQKKSATAWVAFAEGRKAEALAMMRAAADQEDATEKHIVTPGPLAPARELLGFMLIEAGEPKAAVAEFEKSHRVEPNRFHGLAGAARAAELSGDRAKARSYYEKLAALASNAGRPEVARARAVLAN
jgi:tetratricopeptide (TPR) repeat protein